MKQIDSLCNYCGVGCEITAHVKNNEIQSISSKKESTVSEGQLCIKGKYGFDFVSSNERLPKVKVRKSFIDKHEFYLPKKLKSKLYSYEIKDGFIYPNLDEAYELAAWKIKDIQSKYGNFSFASIGGARGNCESSYIFQKFTRKVINSPHIDNCARVCHAPTLKGMRSVIGEGAATNPFSDIYESEFIIVFGSNTTEAHPIVANKIISHLKNSDAKLALFDVREIVLSKKAHYNAIIPYESNLLVANMLAYTIIQEKLYDEEFIGASTVGFDQYKQDILSDEFANPDLFLQIKGYEYLSGTIKEIAREYATKKSLIFWGLGVTEHLDGSYTTASFCNLALLSGNVGKKGAGLMPLRGQNNVQGTCDMGCLPYYDPDYQKPLIEGKKTPDIINAILDGEIKAVFNMGEDIAHIHTNQNKIQKALKNLELLIVNELFDNEITKYADIIFGVKSGYEKSGVYINAERRLHLSQPLIENDLPDDWEVIQGISKALGSNKIEYNSSKEIWQEVQKKAPNRFSGADYEKLKSKRIEGLQWPIFENETPRLHENGFRTKDGLGHFRYKKWFKRGMVKEILNDKHRQFYLSTGRVLEHYNNAAQTKRSPKLLKRHDEDTLLVSEDDREFFQDKKEVVLRSHYGTSKKIKFKITKKIKKGTLFISFHHAKSHINYLFGDEADELTKTARFKSLKVWVE
ncbi:MAG: formate dehydrogenase [Sulfurospirillum sp.]|nr:MAG: formate dehydrogenase [Sulfurospirillum sp.]